MKLYLGIDTSNYTTSVALCGDKTVDFRKLIDVGEGNRGIRQSDGVFLHIKELPVLFEKLDGIRSIKAVGVSVRPRNQEKSYMPVFIAGENFARVIAKSLDVPLFEASHQDGHIMAGIISCGESGLINEEFTAVHLSGGTTEILKCRYKNGSFNPEIIGGTKDISAGQLLDRLGVGMGMKFPCGKELDMLATQEKDFLKEKISVNDGFMNFSGIETKLFKLKDELPKPVIAKTAFEFIGNSIDCALKNIGAKKVLFVGGVASGTVLREKLSHSSYKPFFASPELSSDNAVGIAEIAKKLSEEAI